MSISLSITSLTSQMTLAHIYIYNLSYLLNPASVVWWWKGKKFWQFCVFTLTFVNVTQEECTMSLVRCHCGACFPAVSFQHAALGEGPHGEVSICCLGTSLHQEMPSCGPSRETLAPWSLRFLTRGAGGSHPGGRRFFAGELGQWKAISDHLWSASQTCLLVCLSLILTLAFCSWSGWNRFGFGFSSFIIILECHILWNAK